MTILVRVEGGEIRAFKLMGVKTTRRHSFSARLWLLFPWQMLHNGTFHSQGMPKTAVPPHFHTVVQPSPRDFSSIFAYLTLRAITHPSTTESQTIYVGSWNRIRVRLESCQDPEITQGPAWQPSPGELAYPLFSIYSLCIWIRNLNTLSCRKI